MEAHGRDPDAAVDEEEPAEVELLGARRGRGDGAQPQNGPGPYRLPEPPPRAAPGRRPVAAPGSPQRAFPRRRPAARGGLSRATQRVRSATAFSSNRGSDGGDSATASEKP